MGIFSAVTGIFRKVIPSGTIIGDFLGSTKKKGTNLLGNPKKKDRIPILGSAVPKPVTFSEQVRQTAKESSIGKEQKNLPLLIGGGIVILGFLGWLIFKK